MSPPPSSDEQLSFLAKVQRLFNDGDFTATYKFALMMALADLSVELGNDTGDSLCLSNRLIAIKFIEIYWQQTAPFKGGREGNEPGILAHKGGSQASVITKICEFKRENPATTLHSAALAPGFETLVNAVSMTVSAKPIHYMKCLVGETVPFLYERTHGGLNLLPGVAFCFRRFQPLVHQLARTCWVQHLQGIKGNKRFLGNSDGLEEFLFESSRKTLTAVGVALRKLVENKCFYCGGQIHESDVDHFVPFAMYPRDLAHNFVLSHQSCNRSKSNTLAARSHLDRWLEFAITNDALFQEIGESVGCITDLKASLAVAKWGYANAISSGSMAWKSSRVFERLDASCVAAIDHADLDRRL